eukprot:jgi/Chrzof1/11540/UNPLg00475.t1
MTPTVRQGQELNPASPCRGLNPGHPGGLVTPRPSGVLNIHLFVNYHVSTNTVTPTGVPELCSSECLVWDIAPGDIRLVPPPKWLVKVAYRLVERDSSLPLPLVKCPTDAYRVLKRGLRAARQRFWLQTLGKGHSKVLWGGALFTWFNFEL